MPAMLILDSSQNDFQSRLLAFCGEAPDQASVRDSVAEVIAAVAKSGDKAVADYTRRFDKAVIKPGEARVDLRELQEAAQLLPAAQRRAIKASISCVSAFHRRTKPKNWRARNPHGAMVGEAFYPIRRVGLYIPGGQVPLVSTVIMTAIPAKLAGVTSIAVCTPPQADGSIDPRMLAALHLCGITEVYRIGGIQAMAALALGTATLPAVDKVFGPGNAYVMEAKRQLFGRVGVDLLPGPSEVMIIADAQAKPEWIAADLLAQAEHGTGKEKIYLVTTSKPLIGRVLKACERQAQSLSHAAKVLAVLAKGGVAIKVKNLAATAAVANTVAPEHLELHVEDGALNGLVKTITTAGAILMGSHTPTVLGDFTAGPSHTLPTNRTGRFFSGLQLTDFMRRASLVRYDPKSLQAAAPVVAAFSAMEQLDAHGRSLTLRLND
jgi:histidinol dehydrogenase